MIDAVIYLAVAGLLFGRAESVAGASRWTSLALGVLLALNGLSQAVVDILDQVRS